MLKYFFIACLSLFLSCSNKEDIEKYRIKSVCSANFMVIHNGLYQHEKLEIIVNDTYVYNQMQSDSLCFSVRRSYLLPSNVIKVEVKSYHKGKQYLDKIIIDSVYSQKKLIIASPLPEGVSYIEFGEKTGIVPIEKSHRKIFLDQYNCNDIIEKEFEQ